MPLLHRNTKQFIGMAERAFYLCTRKSKGFFYALDKMNFVSKWCVETGRLLSKTQLKTTTYEGYMLDHEVYDRNWFKYSVVYKQDDVQRDKRRVKVLEISKEGVLQERASFLHPFQLGEEQHFYFSADFSKMIELTLVNSANKADGLKGTYTEYTTRSVVTEKVWNKTRVLNDDPKENYPEWHTKTLYPYPLDPESLSVVVYPEKEEEKQPEVDASG